MLKEFKEFALKGNVLDLAVGVMIGAAFGGVIKSMVDHIISPVIAMIVGKPDFNDFKVGPVLVGSFFTNVVNFLIVAFVLFLIVKGANALKKPEPEPEPAGPTTEELLVEIRDLMKAKG